jgi:hypothetical protein
MKSLLHLAYHVRDLDADDEHRPRRRRRRVNRL